MVLYACFCKMFFCVFHICLSDKGVSEQTVYKTNIFIGKHTIYVHFGGMVNFITKTNKKKPCYMRTLTSCVANEIVFNKEFRNTEIKYTPLSGTFEGRRKSVRLSRRFFFLLKNRENLYYIPGHFTYPVYKLTNVSL